MSDYENMYSETEGQIVDMEHAMANGTPLPGEPEAAPTPQPPPVSADPAATPEETPDVEVEAPDTETVIEEPEQTEEPAELEAAVDGEDTPEEPEGLSDGASNRFQKLVGRAKAAEEKAAKFEELLAQLTETQKAQLDLQTEAWQFQKGNHDAQTAQAQARIREQQLAEAGWDLNKPEHRLLLEERAAREQLEAEMRNLTSQSQVARQEALTAQWQNGIDQVLRSKLSKYEVNPSTVSKFQAQALKIAAAEQLTSPADAVESVLEPVLEYLKPKGGKVKTGPAKGVAPTDKKAFEALATRGKTTSKPAKTTERTIDDIEKEFGLEDGWG